MANRSTIEWTDVTWNPVRGCTKISPGCKHCYAAAFAERFRGVSGHPYEQGFDIRVVPGKLLEPFEWNRPSTVFVNSMSDLFHPDIPESFLRAIVTVMVDTPWHTFQVLTKRAERLSTLLQGTLSFAASCEHIWWGVSVEDRRYGVPRIPHLRESGGAVKFLSVEPLLEDLGELDLFGIDWVIVGGESGQGARAIESRWVTNIRAQCRKRGIPFFFKQWGGRNKKAAGRLLNGKTYDEMPQIRRVSVPNKADRINRSLNLAERLRRDSALTQIHF